MIFKILQGIPLFQAASDSMEDTFTQKTLPLTLEKLNIIKYQLCVPWNNEKTDKKNENKI